MRSEPGQVPLDRGTKRPAPGACVLGQSPNLVRMGPKIDAYSTVSSGRRGSGAAWTSELHLP